MDGLLLLAEKNADQREQMPALSASVQGEEGEERVGA